VRSAKVHGDGRIDRCLDPVADEKLGRCLQDSLRFRAIGIGFAMHRPDRPAAAASADANAETIDAAMSISGVFE
jgi:hypothetical protein